MKKTAAAPNALTTPETLRVAYHAGPPSIGYFGAQWQRGIPQAVTAEAWAAMQARADCAHFDFRIEPATPANQE